MNKVMKTHSSIERKLIKKYAPENDLYPPNTYILVTIPPATFSKKTIAMMTKKIIAPAR
jgi:hypothetical protein